MQQTLSNTTETGANLLQEPALSLLVSSVKKSFYSCFLPLFGFSLKKTHWGCAKMPLNGNARAVRV